MKNAGYFITIVVVIFSLSSLSLQAQKLPNIQQASVYAPMDVKVDGKASEWSKFQALNNATNVFYTIANDADNLYLTIHATDLATIVKLMSGGFKLTIKSANKSEKPIAVTGMLVQPAGRIGGITQKFKDKTLNNDSLITALNRQMATNMKEIGITGVADITDTLISVYNEYNIRQVAKFDTQQALTNELAIPLKYINRLIVGDTFKYNFTLRGIVRGAIVVEVNGIKFDPSTVSTPGSSVREIPIKGVGNTGDFQSMFTPTDFSGSYTLAKK